MSDFSDEWLALRASADSRARADALVRRLSIDQSAGIDVLDLGCGTGANLRHLAPLLAAAGAREQRWTCVDLDSALLNKLPERCAEWAAKNGLALFVKAGVFRIRAQRSANSTAGLRGDGTGWHCRVRPLQLDLATSADQLPLPKGGLVTASALLDLVSASWLDALLRRCQDARCQLLFALSYDGRCEITPSHPDDVKLIDLVNRHQRTNKGLGPALGPEAAYHTEARCRALRYRIDTATSDWEIGPDETALQQALIDGWHRAALELARTGMNHQQAGRIDAWRTDRARMINAKLARLRVGHKDLVAWLDR